MAKWSSSNKSELESLAISSSSSSKLNFLSSYFVDNSLELGFSVLAHENVGGERGETLVFTCFGLFNGPKQEGFGFTTSASECHPKELESDELEPELKNKGFEYESRLGLPALSTPEKGFER
nr:hypothetical protein [Tanacetum cinerariifolium]